MTESFALKEFFKIPSYLCLKQSPLSWRSVRILMLPTLPSHTFSAIKRIISLCLKYFGSGNIFLRKIKKKNRNDLSKQLEISCNIYMVTAWFFKILWEYFFSFNFKVVSIKSSGFLTKKQFLAIILICVIGDCINICSSIATTLWCWNIPVFVLATTAWSDLKRLCLSLLNEKKPK